MNALVLTFMIPVLFSIMNEDRHGMFFFRGDVKKTSQKLLETSGTPTSKVRIAPKSMTGVVVSDIFNFHP